MRKYVVLALLCLAQITFANVVTGQAAVPAGYYNSVDQLKSADAILVALHNCIDNHTSINYSALEDYYEQTDFYADTVWDIYSTCRFTMAQANHTQSKVCDGWNKEHSIPQSWFNEGSPMKSDLFHVYPTDARVNNFRSNLPYGEVSGPNGTGFKDNYMGHGLGKKGANTFPGYTGTVFEPADDYKGDLARTYFYMVARYRDRALNSSEGAKVFTSSPTNLTSFAQALFMKWHRQDPVSQKEIDRNQAVYGIQHNRNPFIDYPELAEYIWGNRVGQTVDLSTMTPTCEGGGYTPVVNSKYGVNWSVNGIVILTDSIIENRAISALPEAPVSCSVLSEVFMGWTNQPLSQSTNQVPKVLYTKLADFPTVNADVTYYAVFAHATQGAVVEPATYIYDTDHKDGWTNNATYTTYWLLDEGKSLVSPEVDLSGLSSIEVNIRTYGGTEYNKLNVKAGTTTIAQIEATNGKILTDYTWTNTASLSGKSQLTFSTSYGSGKGIGVTKVVINATGSGITYSDYLTLCDTTTSTEQIHVVPAARKMLIDGQLYIEINNQIYTITGQKIQ